MQLTNMYIKRLSIAIAALTMVLLGGCNLDVTNPNTATDQEVLNSAEGIRAFTIGMQGTYSGDVYADVVLNTGITTREMAINTTFASLLELEDGGTALPAANSRTNSIWDGLTRIIYMCDEIIASAPEVITDEAERSGIIALASLYKAMSLGYLIQSFEQAPINSGTDAEFFSREQVLQEALDLLDIALTQITNTPLLTVSTMIYY